MTKALSRTVLLGAAERLGPMTLRAWIGSLRTTTITADEALLPTKTGERGVIYAGWHESLLTSAALYGGLKPYTLVSKSRDGEYISRIVSRQGWQVIRGSYRKGEVDFSAVWNIMEALRSHPASHFFLATDGPRGPRRVFKEGAIYLASRTSGVRPAYRAETGGFGPHSGAKLLLTRTAGATETTETLGVWTPRSTIASPTTVVARDMERHWRER